MNDTLSKYRFIAWAGWVVVVFILLLRFGVALASIFLNFDSNYEYQDLINGLIPVFVGLGAFLNIVYWLIGFKSQSKLKVYTGIVFWAGIFLCVIPNIVAIVAGIFAIAIAVILKIAQKNQPQTTNYAVAEANQVNYSTLKIALAIFAISVLAVLVTRGNGQDEQANAILLLPALFVLNPLSIIFYYAFIVLSWKAIANKIVWVLISVLYPIICYLVVLLLWPFGW